MEDRDGVTGSRADAAQRPRVLFIRHAQSLYNAAYEPGRTDPLLYDAPLSPLGHRQVEEARGRLHAEPVDLVIVSPLTRALQTAVGLFVGHPRRPPIVVDAALRERLDNSCDRGRPPSELAAEFPSLGFGHLPDPWWHADGQPDARGLCVEPRELAQRRADEFLARVSGRTEGVVAVVGHGAFFFQALGLHMANCEAVGWTPRTGAHHAA